VTLERAAKVQAVLADGQVQLVSTGSTIRLYAPLMPAEAEQLGRSLIDGARRAREITGSN
jgi:hypothetical protein